MAAVTHPKPGEHGQPVVIKHPSTPTPPASWSDPAAVATFTPGSPVPSELNSIPFASWADVPTTDDGWAMVKGQNPDLMEPTMTVPPGLKSSAGVAIIEDDGRIWLVAPTNRFGNYDQTLPKGTADKGVSLQATAIREAWEEAGLQVEITGFLMDVERSTSVARYYTARRVGGSPADMGWETQAVILCPRERLSELLTSPYDQGLAKALMAQPAAGEE